MSKRGGYRRGAFPKSFENYRDEALRIARDLRYSDVIKAAIKDASTESDIIRALSNGRRAMNP